MKASFQNTNLPISWK